MARMKDGLGHDSSCQCPQHGGPPEVEVPTAEHAPENDDEITLFDGDMS